MFLAVSSFTYRDDFRKWKEDEGLNLLKKWVFYATVYIETRAFAVS